jgi:cephalosporin hydroxylase
MLMVAAVCWVEPPQIFEWGTHIGKSARIFYECATHYRIQADIHSTDLPDEVIHAEHPHSERGRLVRGLPGVLLHQGDGLETSLSLWREAGQRPSPLFFVDGDHRYESVLRELIGITLAVPDATILVHDAFFQSTESRYNVGHTAQSRTS